MAKGNAVIGQSGGPTSVINQSLVGVIQAVQKSNHIDELLGARHGVRGIINEDFVPLRQATADWIERAAQTPAAALGSTRDKPDAAYCEKIVASFKKNNVRFFFYIGGNDSADTARIVQELAAGAKYDMQVFHIPKTIDNDLRVHDHTPGFGSAARFVAAAVMGDNFDNASLPGVKVDVIMGRNAGFLTAAAVLARRNSEDGPHLIYVPETVFDVDQFLGDVDRVHKKAGRCLIAVSEGIHDQSGAPIAAVLAEKLGRQVEKDSHGNVQLAGSGILGDFLGDLIKDKLKIKRVRSDTFGYLQRSFPSLAVSQTDADEARMVGKVAVEYSRDESKREGSIAMIRKSNSNISNAFIEYAKPLVGPLPKTASLDEVR